ncbi:unnamed protein product [Prorocentrum cordatum]|nr:unnamed protein product [Polarella glacialis]
MDMSSPAADRAVDAEAEGTAGGGERRGAPAVEGAAAAPPAVGTRPAGSAAAGTHVVRRGADALAEVMRQRREGCQEFESSPEGHTADAGAALAPGACLELPAGAREFESAPGGCKADASCSQLSEAPAGGGAAAPVSPREFESVPGLSVADFVASASSTRQIPLQGESASQKTAAALRVRGGRRGPEELRAWMRRAREGCEVIESVPLGPAGSALGVSGAD